MKTFKIFTIIGVLVFVLFSFNSFVQEEWKVPAKYDRQSFYNSLYLLQEKW